MGSIVVAVGTLEELDMVDTILLLGRWSDATENHVFLLCEGFGCRGAFGLGAVLLQIEVSA